MPGKRKRFKVPGAEVKLSRQLTGVLRRGDELVSMAVSLSPWRRPRPNKRQQAAAFAIGGFSMLVLLSVLAVTAKALQDFGLIEDEDNGKVESELGPGIVTESRSVASAVS